MNFYRRTTAGSPGNNNKNSPLSQSRGKNTGKYDRYTNFYSPRGRIKCAADDRKQEKKSNKNATFKFRKRHFPQFPIVMSRYIYHFFSRREEPPPVRGLHGLLLLPLFLPRPHIGGGLFLGLSGVPVLGALRHRRPGGGRLRAALRVK